jgi:hypothetical protein
MSLDIVTAFFKIVSHDSLLLVISPSPLVSPSPPSFGLDVVTAPQLQGSCIISGGFLTTYLCHDLFLVDKPLR